MSVLCATCYAFYGRTHCLQTVHLIIFLPYRVYLLLNKDVTFVASWIFVTCMPEFLQVISTGLLTAAVVELLIITSAVS